jgi:hypothetical protein
MVVSRFCAALNLSRLISGASGSKDVIWFSVKSNDTSFVRPDRVSMFEIWLVPSVSVVRFPSAPSPPISEIWFL